MIEAIEKLFALCEQKKIKIVTAESCTGGMVGGLLTEVSGSSKYFECGFITYSNAAKTQQLFVTEASLQKHGAVSVEVASEMAVGALRNSEADLSVAVTGIAGPDGGSEEKPVGLVFIATALGENVFVTKNIFSGSRSEIRQQSVAKAIEMLLGTINQDS